MTYLVKEALTALKARQLAHEAGVVVDPSTSWKWALRQFRDGTGEVKTGKAKREVLDRLLGNPSAGSNNYVQAINKEQRKLRDVDEVQLHRPTDLAEYEHSNKAALNSYTGNGINHRELSNANLAGGIDLHVHPAGRSIGGEVSSLIKKVPAVRNSTYSESTFRAARGAYSDASPSGALQINNGSVSLAKGGDVSNYLQKGNLANSPVAIITAKNESGKQYLGLHRGIVDTSKRPIMKGFRSAYLDVSPRNLKEPNPYLEKIASRQKLDDFAEDPKSFQEPVVKNILTGFTYGGLGGSVYGMRDQLPEMSAALKRGGNEALVEAAFKAGAGVTHHTLKGAMLGAGAGAVYGAIKHIPKTVEHTDNHAHINGVYEYAAGHLDPYMGKVSGGVVGGLIGRRFHIPTRSAAGNIEKWTIGAIPGTIGTLAGAKIGQDQAEKHNNRLLNRIKEKYYE